MSDPQHGRDGGPTDAATRTDPVPAGPAGDPALFDLPPGSREVPTRIVLLTGASGSGKTSLTRRLGLPVVSLDDFYLDHDHPDLPRRFGIVDWDDPRSWDGAGAVAALVDLARTGHADVPVYDIPTSQRTGTTHVDVTGSRVVIAEGIFAAEIVAACRAQDVLADAVCLRRPRLVTFWFRLLRDLAEMRKPPLTLVRRGWALLRAEPRLVANWTSLGCRALGPAQAEKEIRALLQRPAA
ncbi:uridine kinase family protein [Cellulosimicrobium composti]|uniref:uridine kinase family protein n=1 Tax=Cellulosimicrobium composti TaxID=2672572 RepID=UPI0028A1FFB6|nr:ATP-binding protein [Cellulosimicrobium composti]